MIHLTGNSTNAVVVTATELMLNQSLNVLFEFVNTQSFRTEYCITTGNTSAAPGRYDVFNIRVTTGATLSNAEIELNKDGNYIYSCFEWPSSGDPDNINTSVLRKLETGLCHVTGTTASYPNTNTVYL